MRSSRLRGSLCAVVGCGCKVNDERSRPVDRKVREFGRHVRRPRRLAVRVTRLAANGVKAIEKVLEQVGPGLRSRRPALCAAQARGCPLSSAQTGSRPVKNPTSSTMRATTSNSQSRFDTHTPPPIASRISTTSRTNTNGDTGHLLRLDASADDRTNATSREFAAVPRRGVTRRAAIVQWCRCFRSTAKRPWWLREASPLAPTTMHPHQRL
jgi:hypothetical protein